MPKTFEDYAFYLGKNQQGRFTFKGVRGNVIRMEKAEFARFKELMTEEQYAYVEELPGFANVVEFKSGRIMLVYEIFEDLREQIDGKGE